MRKTKLIKNRGMSKRRERSRVKSRSMKGARAMKSRKEEEGERKEKQMRRRIVRKDVWRGRRGGWQKEREKRRGKRKG